MPSDSFIRTRETCLDDSVEMPKEGRGSCKEFRWIVILFITCDFSSNWSFFAFCATISFLVKHTSGRGGMAGGLDGTCRSEIQENAGALGGLYRASGTKGRRGEMSLEREAKGKTWLGLGSGAKLFLACIALLVSSAWSAGQGAAGDTELGAERA